ncbi:hypothetical protein [Nonomuraea gerenzanensis]|uniref:Uncharacterized protein n=1 Tax=Nonomuraea gerenzanensis TaxID=93944 RepID=A0A1M4EJ94_9ACTN|nr:hypothetical protein [Nonomuraea gerenzanensis]UBU10561.1 hypothetical protein LCN96_40460 [Nonomuraea gerenzanensis]SBO98971.1 hypothetical protein BN4615_P8487 [Nonomuraea gerenzanensis]
MAPGRPLAVTPQAGALGSHRPPGGHLRRGLAGPLLEGDTGPTGRLIAALVPLATILLLATPSAGRWFDR